jgi:hypothetical protein
MLGGVVPVLDPWEGIMGRTVNVHLRGGERVAFATTDFHVNLLVGWFKMPKGMAHTTTGTDRWGNEWSYTFAADSVDAVIVSKPKEAA